VDNLAGGHSTSEKRSISADESPHLLGALANHFDAEASHASLDESGHDCRRTLGRSVKYGISATDISLHGVVHAHAVAQVHHVLFARTSARPVVVPGR
jgi:hypothetical protein